ncbi:MAG: helix-turn-helix domain-containing protein, partial [Bacilli bacterium]
MKKYKRINQETRIMIQAYLMKGCKVKEIAKLLGFNKSSIYRELNKNQTIKYGVNIKCHKQNKYPTCNSCPTRAYCNKTKHYYNNEDAHEKSLHNLINSRKHSRLTRETIE